MHVPTISSGHVAKRQQKSQARNDFQVRYPRLGNFSHHCFFNSNRCIVFYLGNAEVYQYQETKDGKRSIASLYPTGDSQNFHMFSHIIQELNRKLDQFGLTSNIIQPVDAGFRLLNFNDFFGDANPSPNLPDYLELEDDDFLLQENGFKLILEQDI